MPSTFPESPGPGYGALGRLEMLCAAFRDSEGNVGSQGRGSASQGGGDVSGRLRSGSAGSWRASRRCCWMSFSPEGMGVRKAELQEQGNLRNGPWCHLALQSSQQGPGAPALPHQPPGQAGNTWWGGNGAGTSRSPHPWIPPGCAHG